MTIENQKDDWGGASTPLAGGGVLPGGDPPISVLLPRPDFRKTENLIKGIVKVIKKNQAGKK